MIVWDVLAALFFQPQYGLPLLLLSCCALVWWTWESHLLPAELAPYAIRPPWLLDTVRLLHEALNTGKLGATIQVTFTWLSHGFRQKYGVSISRFVRPRGFFLRRQIPNRPLFRRAVRGLQHSFYEATYAEDDSTTSWLAAWRRPRARARAQRIFIRILPDLEAAQAQLVGVERGAGT